MPNILSGLHQHNSKVVDWKFDENYNQVPARYECTICQCQYPSIPEYDETPSEHSQHTSYIDSCFGCKVRTLELSTGDAGRSDSMSDKKWNAELSAYRDARSQGIQPAGTTMKAVQDAYDASERLGAAYNADVMPETTKITKASAEVFKHTGEIV